MSQRAWQTHLLQALLLTLPVPAHTLLERVLAHLRGVGCPVLVLREMRTRANTNG